MENTKMQEIQKKLIDFQVNLREKIITDDDNITCTMNGRFEIIEIEVKEDQSLLESIPVLKESINALIKKVSIKIQENLKSISSQYQ
jgi:DNA-binding protein YbaB